MTFFKWCKPTPLGIVWVPTGPILPPTWNSVGTNRANTANPLGILWVPTGPILPTHLEFCAYQPGQYCHPLGILWVPTGSILPTHLEFCGYQPDLYCQLTGNYMGTNRTSTAECTIKSPPWKQMDPHGGPWETMWVLHFTKLPVKPLVKTCRRVY